jgi:hypothetical protein
MPFYTIVEFEWDGPDAQAAFERAMAVAAEHAPAAAGQLSKIVGLDEGGARVVELWSSYDDARRFAEASAPALAAVAMPSPVRVVGFEVTTYEHV